MPGTLGRQNMGNGPERQVLKPRRPVGTGTSAYWRNLPIPAFAAVKAKKPVAYGRRVEPAAVAGTEPAAWAWTVAPDLSGD